jgi:hypothetical protein
LITAKHFIQVSCGYTTRFIIEKRLLHPMSVSKFIMGLIFEFDTEFDSGNLVSRNTSYANVKVESGCGYRTI